MAQTAILDPGVVSMWTSRITLLRTEANESMIKKQYTMVEREEVALRPPWLV